MRADRFEKQVMLDAFKSYRVMKDFGVGWLRELPDPDVFQEGDQFVQRLWRDWLTADVLAGLGLNPRQARALGLIRQQRRITTAEFQRLTAASRATAKRDLEDLVTKGLLQPAGAGRGAHYRLAPKRLVNGSNGSPASKVNGS